MKHGENRISFIYRDKIRLDYVSEEIKLRIKMIDSKLIALNNSGIIPSGTLTELAQVDLFSGTLPLRMGLSQVQLCGPCADIEDRTTYCLKFATSFGPRVVYLDYTNKNNGLRIENVRYEPSISLWNHEISSLSEGLDLYESELGGKRNDL